MKDNKKYYNVELNKEESEQLKIYLKENKIYYEPSQCYNLIHFEIKCNKEELEKVNQFLDTLL